MFGVIRVRIRKEVRETIVLCFFKKGRPGLDPQVEEGVKYNLSKVGVFFGQPEHPLGSTIELRCQTMGIL